MLQSTPGILENCEMGETADSELLMLLILDQIFLLIKKKMGVE